jgi:hypothetical protein
MSSKSHLRQTPRLNSVPPKLTSCPLHRQRLKSHHRPPHSQSKHVKIVRIPLLSCQHRLSLSPSHLFSLRPLKSRGHRDFSRLFQHQQRNHRRVIQTQQHPVARQRRRETLSGRSRNRSGRKRQELRERERNSNGQAGSRRL